jgi:hypothetical protein
MLESLWEKKNRWQFELIADSGIFRPVCYQTGHCMFQASADRGCTIRGRVELNADHGIPSSEWDKSHPVTDIVPNPGGPQHMQTTRIDTTISAINQAEWLLDPAAARRG